MGERRIRRYARTWFNMQIEIVACAAVHDWKGVGLELDQEPTEVV
jgi:hypothetical protein